MYGMDDRVVMVTGASEGIGREMVRLFAGAGARVVAVARRPEPLEALAAEVGVERVLPAAADVRRMDEVESAVAKGLGRWGRIDILVNNAGVARYRVLKDLTAEDWQWQMDVNLTGVFNCCKAVLPQMLALAARTRERPSGQVLNISSVLGTVGMARGTAYCATKWGLMGFTESLRMEVQKEGIRVMVLAPGLTQTDFAGNPAAGKADGLKPGTVAEHALHMLAAPGDALPGTVILRPFQA